MALYSSTGYLEGHLIGHVKTSVANLTTRPSCLHSPGQVNSSLHAMFVNMRWDSSEKCWQQRGWGGGTEPHFCHLADEQIPSVELLHFTEVCIRACVNHDFLSLSNK